ncbi:VOC family protein [Alcaligenes sp. 13f]|uniref:VOC family protein n=1 Tax=Alcaligenes sp. 13f TaxID=2841924 RepID=UPI001CF68985|nr:VOC family protein [Alcaligenes sp. 13f]MCB4321524.1 VOC family protein [Alcaligenes sp. 13f]
MLHSVDRILVAVRSLDDAEANYANLLGATQAEDFVSSFLSARVRRMDLGSTQVELCEPKGDGPVKAYLDAWGEGLFYGGVCVKDLLRYEQQLRDGGVSVVRADDRLYLETDDLHGLPLVVSEAQERSRASGPVEFLYELTMVLRSPWQKVAERYTAGLGLQEDRMVGITFERFGYTGTLMMFQRDRLDRIELSEAHDPAFAMGRFSAKRGDALYMCYVQTDDLADVIARLEAHGKKWTRRTQTPQERDGLWIHPSALNGVLMGVSRHSLAWQWSGRPDWVEALEELQR